MKVRTKPGRHTEIKIAASERVLEKEWGLRILGLQQIANIYSYVLIVLSGFLNEWFLIEIEEPCKQRKLLADKCMIMFYWEEHKTKHSQIAEIIQYSGRYPSSG